MAAKFLMSRYDYGVSNLFKKLGYKEVEKNETPDFIVFGGGADVTPNLYNQTPLKTTYCSEEIDYQDFCTVIAGKLKQIPMVGICRGLQLLHVGNGGTLMQHIYGHSGTTHCLLSADGGRPIQGWEELKVNSAHHQCVPLEETDYAEEVYISPQQTVEVLVATNVGFIGVQYHPEYHTCPADAVDFFAELMKHKFEGIL